MKIVAFRDRDVDDIVDLMKALNLTTATADQLATLVADAYDTPERLALAIGGPDEDAPRELLVRCQQLGRLLAEHRADTEPEAPEPT